MSSKAQEILAAVEAESSVIGSVLTLVESLATADVISPEVAQAILGTIAGDKAALEAALLANTPQRPQDQPEGFSTTDAGTSS